MLTAEKLEMLHKAFRPHFPIVDPGAFFGRERDRARTREALSQPGLHVVVYGERGSGKTSLVNVTTVGVPRVDVFCEKHTSFSRILRDMALQLQKLEPGRIIYDASKDTIAAGGIILTLEKLTGNDLLSIIPADKPLCVVLDELDRVKDKQAIELIAELTKNAATNHPLLTLVMIGVANTADELLLGHASNFRNILEVQLDRMEEDDLRAILARGQQVLGITFSEKATNHIIALCDRTPYYLHLLATESARPALDAGAPTIEIEDVAQGCRDAAKGADQQLRAAYDHAILSERGTHIYQRIIWAMANLASAANNLSDITVQVNNIALSESDKPVTQQAVGGALKRLASPVKRKIIYQPIPGVYRFSNPLMKGFIKLVRYQT
jgi:hypothetical protein